MTSLDFASLRAEALFVSSVQRWDNPTREQVRAAVTASLNQHGPGGCASRLAQEYGEHPVEASVRMSWALAEVAVAYPNWGSRRRTAAPRPWPKVVSARRPSPDRCGPSEIGYGVRSSWANRLIRSSSIIQRISAHLGVVAPVRRQRREQLVVLGPHLGDLRASSPGRGPGCAGSRSSRRSMPRR